MIEAELPDGTVLEFPEGTSPEVVQRVVKQRLGAKPEERSQLAALGGAVGQGVGNVALGAQNLVGMGLEKIGAEKAGKWLQEDAAKGKAKLQSEIAPYEEQYPITVGGGRFGGEVLSTLPVGGVLGKVASMVPGTSGLVTALRSGGLASPATGNAIQNAALRLAGGAAVGGTSAALMDPEQAGTGAAIGAALPVAQAALRAAGPLLTKVAGTTTGAGDAALSQAYQAGKTGGAASQAFRENMRGGASMLDVLDDAKANLAQLQAQRSAQYQASTAGMRANMKPVDLAPIVNSVESVADDFMFKGQAKNPQAAQAIQKAREMVGEWAQLDPAQYHTPAGIDALKQQIGALREGIPFEQRSARTAIDRVYRSIGDQIKAADPEYAKAMGDYAKASDLIDEVQRALSLNERASADTAMRKLQSLMRNNANTNYGARLGTAQALEEQGGRQLMPALAGQALNSWTPRSLQGAAASGAGGVMALSGNVPGAAAMAASSSPRLMGETFYGAGRAAGAIDPRLIEALRRGVVPSAAVLGAQ